MIGTSLAAMLAVLAPNPQDLTSGPVPYTAVQSTAAPVSAYRGPRVLNDQDTALFRQGLAAARARDVAGTQAVLAQIGTRPRASWSSGR